MPAWLSIFFNKETIKIFIFYYSYFSILRRRQTGWLMVDLYHFMALKLDVKLYILKLFR